MSLLCRIVLLGELSVRQQQRQITRFRTQKAGALLALLAYHLDRSHPRELLLELLWPQLDPAAGRSNLSFVLSSLRHQLEPPGVAAGAVLIADRHSVRLNPEAVSTDVADFEARLKAVEGATEEAARAQRLQETLSLYRGALLPGYYEEWIAPERQRLSDLYVNAARRLIHSLAKAGDSGRALDEAQRVVGVDPLREALHCDLMRLYVAVGQVDQALQQFSVLERLLHQQLGEKPSASTRQLVREIRNREQQAQALPLPPLEEWVASTAAAQERVSYSMETADLTLARRASAPTTLPRQGVVERVAPPTGTVTLLLAQTRNAPDPHEGRTDVGTKAKTRAQIGEPTLQTVETDVIAPGDTYAGRQQLMKVSALLRRELGRHGGYPFQRARHGQGMAFQSVGEALSCAIAIQRNLAALHTPEEGNRAGVCMALHTGDLEPGAQDFGGRVLEQTRRLLDAGHPGQILCSEAAAALLRRDLQAGEHLQDLGLFRLRDVPLPEHIFEVEYPGKVPKVCPPLRAEAGYTPHLPLPLTRFFGREELLTRLQSLLLEEKTRLVTLTGTGGMGKTRLSIEVARRLTEGFGGAVWFVPLADVGASTGLLNTLIGALGLPGSSRVEPLEQIQERLSGQRSLLVLDNFEHLVETEAATLGLLLERVERLTCLVTSRQRLELGGEQEVMVPALPVPEPRGVTELEAATGRQRPTPNAQRLTPNALLSVPSLALFVDRAQAVKPDFQLTVGNAEALSRLCEGLEGIPLAVELAASRAQVLTPSQMLSQMSDRFGLLVSRRRDVAPRHRTLRAAIDWSYQLLSPPLQRFFCRLSVFRGGFSLEAAEAVCEEELALDCLAQLRECSLVVIEETMETIRFQMLETLREYTGEKLEESGEATEARNRHLAYYLGLAEAAEPELQRSEQQVWLQRLETEHDNLRAALSWCLKSKEEEEIHPSSFILHPSAASGLRLAGSLWRFWQVRGHRSEGRQHLKQALQREDAQQATLARARALFGAGTLAWSQSDFAAAQRLFEESLVLLRELGHQRGIAHALNGLGLAALPQGEFASARALFEESLAIYRELGDKHGIAIELTNLGSAAKDQGEFATARVLLEESLSISRELGDQGGIALTLHNLGYMASSQGDYGGARTLHEESLALRRELEDRGGMAMSLASLGYVVYLQGEFASAQALFEQSLGLCRELGDRQGVVILLGGIAMVLQGQGEARKAVRLWGASEALRERLGSPVPPNEREEYDHQVARAHSTLGGDVFAVIWEEGRALTWEQAVSYALEPALP